MLRYSDAITKVDTIKEHQELLYTKKTVWMGKFGVGISNKFFDIAKNQLKVGDGLFLYLMKGTQYTHKAKIIDIIKGKDSKTEISTKEKDHTPSYYRNKRCTIWFKLSSIDTINENELDNLWLYKDPASHPSNGGMRGLIYLTYREGELPSKIKCKSSPNNILYTGSLFD